LSLRKQIAAVLAGFCLLALGGCRREPLPDLRQYAYITNGRSNSVSVVDLYSFRAIKTIPVGRNPTGVTASPVRNELYVANTGSDNVSVIDAERNLVVAAIGVHHAPYFIDVSPDGKRGYVANSGSANVSVLDL